MNYTTTLKRTALGFTTMVAAFSMSTTTVSAIAYNGDNTVSSPTPAFNVFTGVPSVGNEADFLRARVPTAPTGDTSTAYVDPLNASCVNGQRIQMRVYVHNGANANANNNGSGPSVARGTKVKVNVPSTQATSFTSNATISSTNAGTVNDNVAINCNGKTVKLKYIPGSASQFSIGSGVVPLSDAITTTGVPIRSQSVAGDVWGCWNDRVYVILSVQVEEVTTPPPVIPPTTTTPPKTPPVTPPSTPVVPAAVTKEQPTPIELPATGPAAVGLIATVVSGVSGLGYHLIRRRFSV